MNSTGIEQTIVIYCELYSHPAVGKHTSLRVSNICRWTFSSQVFPPNPNHKPNPNSNPNPNTNPTNPNPTDPTLTLLTQLLTLAITEQGRGMSEGELSRRTVRLPSLMITTIHQRN